MNAIESRMGGAAIRSNLVWTWRVTDYVALNQCAALRTKARGPCGRNSVLVRVQTVKGVKSGRSIIRARRALEKASTELREKI